MMPPIAEELQEQAARGQLALFISADLPREVTGLPSRADLARDLAQRKGLDESLSLAEVAQRVARGGNRWEFTAFIRDQLDTTGKSPQPFHQRVVALIQEHRIETLITTAYDNLLEMAFQEAGVPVNRLMRGSDVSFIAPDRPTLIKLYGDAQQPDTLVVTADDHYGLWWDRDKEDLLHEVRSVLRRQAVLFLGYNLSDPDFNLLWREVLDRAGRFARTAYAVWPGLPEGEVRMWRDRGIKILKADPLGILGEFEAPSASERRPEPEADISESFIGGKDMDYERGLDVLKRFAEGTDWYDDFDVYEAQLRENLGSERRYGPSEQSRRDRARIVDHLNALAREHLDISFNALCIGELPRVKRLDEADDEDIAALIRELKAIVREANADEHEVSERIWQAVQQGRVEQGEIAARVEALRRWARSVQEMGLPADDDLRTAILSLAQPAESTEGMYNYLHFALPLLPGLLSVESEIDLNKLWAEIKERWDKGSAKGDGETTNEDVTYGTGNPWAVLVGVNEYDDKANYGRLQVCVRDVEAVRGRLVAGGFDPDRIRLLTDHTDESPTRANILATLKAVADATEPDDLLLFYYSGHGEEDGGESYLVARDGRRLVLGDTAVSISRVKGIMEVAPARAKVIVLDACHSGADIGGKGPKLMSEAFIRRVFEEAEGMAILASCKQGQLSYEWRENECSVFTHFLLEALTGEADRDEKGFVSVQDASRHVTNGVKLWASQRKMSQTPTLHSTVAGDIILVRHQ